MSKVLVVNKYGRPLMPTSPRKTRKLLENGFIVIAPVRKESVVKIDELKDNQNLKIIEGSFYNKELLSGIGEKIDIILHFASIRGAGVAAKEAYHKVNVEGTKILLDFARETKIPKFIFCSSVGVLGSIPKKLPASINDLPNPDGYYHKSKYEAEKLVVAADCEALRTCSLRPPVTYGFKDDGFIPRMISMVKSKTLILPIKDIKLHLLSASAFANFIIKIFTSENWYGKIFNVADKEPVLLNDLVNEISLVVFGKRYLNYLKAPNVIFNLAIFILNLLKIQKLKTSIELISKTRYYDISETIRELHFEPVDTLKAIRTLNIN